MTEKTDTAKVILTGGLDTNENWLEMSDLFPGRASKLVNFESSLFGGYRKINGFMPLEGAAPEVDPAGAEGRILGVAIFKNKIIAIRKELNESRYNFYGWDKGVGWTKYTTGITHVFSVDIDKVRWATFNFDGTDKIIFVDGVNKAVVYDGTGWYFIGSSATGADKANAGGDQAIDAPKYVTIFENHIFVSGDPTYRNIISHSAPLSDYNWTAASGAGQLNSGFNVIQIRPFRDTLYVFACVGIKKIDVDQTTFVINDVTKDLGCVASDSVIEINGDLIFLSQDGIRPISATTRINDIEIGVLSKNIQENIRFFTENYAIGEVDSVLIRSKSQVRFFFGSSESDAVGIIGCIRKSAQGEEFWEWGLLQGISTSCATSGYFPCVPGVGTQEWVIHGGYDGKVYQQEVGNSFNGNDIFALYTSPYLDFGEPQIRKTLRKVQVFARPEGSPFRMDGALRYDWKQPHVINPLDYNFTESGTNPSFYGDAIYGEATYGITVSPILMKNVSGSGFSVQITLISNNQEPSFSLQGILFALSGNGRE